MARPIILSRIIMAPHMASMSRNETSIARATIGYSPPNRQNSAYPKPNRTVSSASGQPVIPCRARIRREGTPGNDFEQIVW
jgi:hypothetical protein